MVKNREIVSVLHIMHTILDSVQSLKTTPSRLHTKRANLPRRTTHVTVIHGLALKSKFAKRAISFANLLSLQSGVIVTTLLGICRAPTSLGAFARKKSSLSGRLR
jgi:hypothetical protein